MADTGPLPLFAPETADVHKASAKVKGELPGRGQQYEKEAEATGRQAGAKFDEAVCFPHPHLQSPPVSAMESASDTMGPPIARQGPGRVPEGQGRGGRLRKGREERHHPGDRQVRQEGRGEGQPGQDRHLELVRRQVEEGKGAIGGARAREDRSWLVGDTDSGRLYT